jgi:4-amino-4-deoxy-L-arabinose transferase-like glycosyltransferase
VQEKKTSFLAWIQTKTHLLLPGMILVLYFLLHLPKLTNFPVFADESIYIRWAQLIMDDARQFAFFSMTDGKTPLYIWLLIPFQYLFSDQLFAGRFLSVLVGAVQIFVIQALIQVLGGRKKVQWLGMVLTVVLPFWFFYHQLALMDGLLTLFLSLLVLAGIQLVQNFQAPFFSKNNILWTGVTGVCFGLALWTKLPALFFAPAFFFFILLPEKKTGKERLLLLIPLGVAGVIGLGMLALFRFAPGFGQLFSRSQDFTYSFRQVLLEGKWKDTLINVPTYFYYFLVYLTWPVLLLTFMGVFSDSSRRKIGVLLAFAFVFCFPFALLGKVVYARYLLPAVPFMTAGAMISLQAFYDRYFQKNTNMSLVQIVSGLFITFFISTTIYTSAIFIATVMLAPDSTPFVQSDRQQYLNEWSSGHGIAQTVDYIRQQAQDHTIAVATEGRFGTLPDGLLLYFHNTDVHNIYIEGTGQYPVKNLPDFFTKRAKDFDQVILVVNSHRMAISLPENKLLKQYCRPNSAPCLQVWDVTDLAKK